MDFFMDHFCLRIMCVLDVLGWWDMGGEGRGSESGRRIIVQVVEISSHSLDGQRDGLRFKSYMRDVMSGKFRDVIH